MPSSPHDALFKAAFTHPDVARSEMELVLPAAIRTHLDLKTLEACPGSYVDEELHHLHSDLLYAVRTHSGDEGLVYVLFEHQSSADPTMPFRLLRYLVRIWERWQAEHPGSTRLPVVLPVVMHHGEAPWSTSPELACMLDASPSLLEATRMHVPHFRFLLDDLAPLTPAVLAGRTLGAMPRLVQLALWASRSFSRLRNAAPFMRDLAASLTRDARTRTLLTQLFLYLLITTPPDVEAREIRTILLEVAGAEGEEDVMNAAEQLRAEGRAEGEQKGLRDAIVLALAARSVRLSDVGSARLAACTDVAVLTGWLARAVTAASEAEVFTSEGV